MGKRFITRIELTEDTRRVLSEITEANGMTQVSTLSRLVQWFASQPSQIQGPIVSENRKELVPPIAIRNLRAMAERD
jgi:hypothetical protein